MSVKNKAILVVVLIFCILSGFYLSAGIRLHDQEIELLVEREKKGFDYVVVTIRRYLLDLYKTRMENFVKVNPEIVEAFAARDRERLYRLTLPIYQTLTSENPYLRVMHFHDTEGRSFLRMHKPGFYGDDLRAVRPAIQLVHRERRQITCFEIGRYGCFYRVIQPVFHNGTYIGAVEVGIDARALVDALRERLDVVAAAYFRQGLWKKATLNDQPQQRCGDYVLVHAGEAQFKALPADFDLVSEGDSLVLNGRDYILHRHAILRNHLNEPIGGIVALQDITPYLSSKHQFIRRAVLFSLILLGLSLLVLYLSFGGLIGTLERFRNRQQELIDELTTEVAERKLAEDALRQSESKLNAMLHSVGDLIFMVDEDLEIVWANELAWAGNWRNVVSRKCHEAIGCRAGDDECPARQAFASEQIQEAEVQVVAAGGEERTYRCTANVALRNDDGSPATVIEIFRDVTPRKQAEAALARLDRQHRLLLDAAGEGIYGVDLDGMTTFVNPAAARLTGFSAGELIGRHQHEIIHHTREDGTPYAAAECPVEICLRDGEVRSVIGEVFWRKDGSHFPVEYVVTPVREEDGEIIGAVVVFKDISERRHLEHQLRHAQKMEAVGRLAGGIAHDFNNLLSTILGYSELILLRQTADDPLRPYIEAIHEAGRSSAGLTRQLLAFSRKQVLEMQRLDLSEVVGNISRMIARMIGEDIELEILPTGKPCPIVADPVQIEQILMNLAVNARDAMPDGGTLMIETGVMELTAEYASTHQGVEAGPYAMLMVSDTGEGMPPEIRERIFEPFFTTKAVGKGTGLGLATVHGIVKQHHGHIFVYSEPGRGTTFKLYFPLQRGQPAAQAGAAEEAPLPTGSETLLVVDDDRAILVMLREVLEPLGYRVLTAESADEALAVTADGPVDLLITDLIMPGKTGFELGMTLRGRFPMLRILIMSGYTGKIIDEQLLQQEELAFVQKPLMLGKLARKIRILLDDAGGAPPRARPG